MVGGLRTFIALGTTIHPSTVRLLLVHHFLTKKMTGETKPKKPVSTSVSFVTGFISGAIECTAVWPMEYIKTQLQLQKPPYTGVISGLKYTVRTTGFFSLYSGLGVTLIGTMPKSGIRFGGNAYFKKLLADDKGKLNMGQQFLAGMGAGMVEAVVAVTPMETIKTKLIQTNQSLVPGVKAIMRESGLAGFYQGVTATILKQSSNQGLRFMCFNKYKDIRTQNGKLKLSVHDSLIGGLIAGCCSVLGNNPIDVVKTRMQGKDAGQYKNTWDCFARVIKDEGFRGLYKGVVPRMGRVVPGQGIIFMSYEAIEGYVQKAME